MAVTLHQPIQEMILDGSTTQKIWPNCHPSDCTHLNSITSSLVVGQSYIQMCFWKNRKNIHTERCFFGTSVGLGNTISTASTGNGK